MRREFERQGGYFLNADDAGRLAVELVTPERLPNPSLVGKTALEIAGRVGIDAPTDTRVLIAPLDGVGRDHPLSIEKLCPVLSFYVVPDWRAACERCKEILRYGGMGHTMAIHSQDEQVILEFGLRKPAFRIVVNTPTTFGSIGMTTGLDPSMTLGCGGYGGNITSDNITPRHLLNIKRLAYEVRPATRSAHPQPTPPASPRLPEVPTKLVSGGLDPGLLARRIETFLTSRGIASSSAAFTRARHRGDTETTRRCLRRPGTRHTRRRAAGAATGAGRDPGRIRVRGRCAPGDASGPADRGERPDDYHPGGT